MGYIRHHAIVVTSWSGEIVTAHVRAITIFGSKQVSRLLPEVINGFQSFLVGPDGSKEGWEDSDDGDALRRMFKEWLGEQVYEDGSSALTWVEVQYGDDDLVTKIVSDSDERQRSRDESP